MIDPSLKKKLVHEDRWSRTYEAGENFYASESKFDADGLSVSLEELSSDWDSWNESERLSFVNAYRSKAQFVQTDEKVLEFLVAKGDDPVWSTIAASLALHHSNKKMVLEFLMERLKRSTEPKSNFILGLCILRDKAALPELHQLHDQLAERVKAAPQGKADHWIINDFLRCCQALGYLEKTEYYEEEIRPFLNDPDEIIRIHARNALATPQPR